MNKFCGKVLLFGEYSVVKGGKGLALPLFKYSGSLDRKAGEVHAGLAEFAQYLGNSNLLREALDLERLEQDVEEGLVFNSDIPQGSGVGSSGALCAAVYVDYHRDPALLKSRPVSEVMDHMALMESFYHGSSSGLDPLISFAQRPALVSHRNKVEFIDFDSSPELELYLHNTEAKRKTAPLVHQFLKMCEDKEFAQESDEFIRISDKLILSFLQRDNEAFDELFYQLSKWQYLHLRPMVCSEIDAFWLEGLESKKHYVKLCGAGGGGHYIIYKRSPDAVIPERSLRIKH